ncbi:TetR family transcriptional regulator [Silvanigrella paludirubra]|uniref:TetR family transcriptional regulator n=1 Tax=Silvanigrella paludirubra TaxID=2499159 RepID=A0A6N6VXI3_9BACT|nr:TetR/AcrR family transcriptional regulator [Silvanigrella paludirubra]KAB8040814.1 TetR family transcriptional regulator [Silvanigrella paludirubra]
MIKKRAYNTESRKIQAIETKTRVLASAKNLFITKGFDNVTMDEIAKIAGVSTPSVYSFFKSKQGVIRSIMDEALEKEKFEELVQKVTQIKTLKGRLEISAKISRRLYDAEKDQINSFRNTSVLGPEFKAIEKEREERRYQRQEKTLKEVANEESLAEGINLKKAREILWAFTGRDIYRLLVIDKEWTSDEYEKWLAHSLIKLIAK